LQGLSDILDSSATWRKGASFMKRVTRIAVFAVAVAVLIRLAGVAPRLRPLVELEGVVKAANENILTFDVACDCRTGVGGPNRGDPFIISGKIFPAGTLPSGIATNDPTLPVNGVAPIGVWTCRGQNAFPLPAAIASAYSASPFAYFDWHFVLNDGRGLNVAGYPITETHSILSVTGGIGSFSGASGQVEALNLSQGATVGTNATGCPNFRVKFTFQPGSVR
jgi:hypothetical protein